MITGIRREPVASVSLAFTVVAMIATPLFPRAGTERQLLANVVVLGLLGVGVVSAWTAYGVRALAAAGLIMVLTFCVELLGSSTGFPFGEYDYTTALSPRVGGVPLLVCCAWAAITLIVHGMFRVTPRAIGRRMVLMAVSITAWDVFLDPQMVGEGYWQWETSAPAFRGIPLVNYAGWGVTALMTSVLAVVTCGRTSDTARTMEGAGVPLVTYATLTVMYTIGFVFFFDDTVVAVVGAVAMGWCLWRGVVHRVRPAGVMS